MTENSFLSFPITISLYHSAAATASLQSCLTLCDPIDGSLPGYPVPLILQSRTLEWVAISFSNVWKWKVKVKSLSCVQLLATPWPAVHQAPPSMGFSRQEYWSAVPLPSPLPLWWNCYSKNIINYLVYKPLHGPEFEWTAGVADGQVGLVCCDSWGRKESDTTEQLNWTDINL